MAGIKDKFSGLTNLFNKDKFDSELKVTLKKRNFFVANKISDTLYEISSGTSSFRMDFSEYRQQFDTAGSDMEIADIMNKLEFECVTESKMISFTNSQVLLRFLVMREKDLKDGYIYTDFISGLKKVIVYTSDDINLLPLQDYYLKKWGVPREVVFSVADRNMCKLLEKAEINESDLGDAIKAVEFSLPSKELCVSMMMCNDFRRTVYKLLGAKFLVVAPSRENLLILENVTNNILEGLGTVIINEYKKAEHPLTTDVLLFSPNGIEIAGRFSAGEIEEEENPLLI